MKVDQFHIIYDGNGLAIADDVASWRFRRFRKMQLNAIDDKEKGMKVGFVTQFILYYIT